MYIWRRVSKIYVTRCIHTCTTVSGGDGASKETVCGQKIYPKHHQEKGAGQPWGLSMCACLCVYGMFESGDDCVSVRVCARVSI